MTKVQTLNLNIPFAGFYDSWYSGEVDHREEMEIENQVTERELGHPEELRLTADEYADALRDCSDYSAMYHAIARAYSDAFNTYASELCGFPLRLAFETMQSPREYNFATDRIFCDVPVSVVRRLFAKSRANGHAALEKAIKERFTSCSGFISHYPNRLGDWLERPVTDWDHNELGTLLGAVMTLSPDWRAHDWENEVFNMVCDGDGVCHEYESGVDWPKLDARVAELREEKAQEIAAENPDYEPPYRCPLTPDLFTGRIGA